VTRLFFVAGESSGDLHGANLVRALRVLEPGIACEGLGGRLMEEAGFDLHYDLAGDAIMGFAEVVRSLGRIRRVFLDAAAHITANPPDAVVLIDYPGFNLRFAARAHALGIPVVYYISPQVWAWKRHRVRQIARTVDRMLVILPFEQAFYRQAGVDVTYVGHPLVDHVARAPVEGRLRGDAPLVGLLPGSREQEIGRILPVMLDVARRLRDEQPGLRFAAPCVDPARAAQIRALAGDFPVEVVVGGMYEVLDAARFALVASGTATVETALFGVPMAVLYRVVPATYWLARTVVRVEHIAMVNILAGERLVPEFVQHEARADAIVPVARALLQDTPARAAMVAGLGRVREALGGGGASERAAEEVLRVARRKAG
jgi:lipid-A-disaccharide synthase